VVVDVIQYLSQLKFVLLKRVLFFGGLYLEAGDEIASELFEYRQNYVRVGFLYIQYDLHCVSYFDSDLGYYSKIYSGNTTSQIPK
jgi:hypothetical protein